MELVERREWICERRFLHALNFCVALPGPEAQQLASYIGYSMYGVRGGDYRRRPVRAALVRADCGLSAIYAEYGEVAAVAGIVHGLGAAVMALVLAALIRVGTRVDPHRGCRCPAVAAFVAIVAGLPFLVVVGRGGARSATWPDADRRAVFGRLPARGRGSRGARADRPSGSAAGSLITLAIWLVPLALLLLAGGLVAQLAGFFTLAALVTFGGAYAVLPFVAGAAVNHYGWLDRARTWWPASHLASRPPDR